MASSLSYYGIVVGYLLRRRSVKRQAVTRARGRVCYRPVQILAISGPKLANDAIADAPSTQMPPTLATIRAREIGAIGGSVPDSSWVTLASSASSPPMAAAAPRSTSGGPAITL